MQYFFNWDEVEAEDHALPSSRCRIKLITGEQMQLIWAEIQPGGQYEMHSHPHEQFSMMLAGRMQLTVGEQERLVAPGDIWHVPPNVVHGGRIVGDERVVFMDVFHPIREDVLEEMRQRKARRL